jgi:hypothetical protein
MSKMREFLYLGDLAAQDPDPPLQKGGTEISAAILVKEAALRGR